MITACSDKMVELGDPEFQIELRYDEGNGEAAVSSSKKRKKAKKKAHSKDRLLLSVTTSAQQLLDSLLNDEDSF